MPIRIVDVCSFVCLTFVVTPLIKMSFFDWTNEPLNDSAALIAIMLASSGIVARLFKKWPKVIAGAMLVATFAFVQYEAVYGPQGTFRLASWFVAVPFWFYMLRTVNKGRSWRTVQYETQLPFAIGLLLLYATLLYPHLRPEFGGGKALDVTVYFG